MRLVDLLETADKMIEKIALRFEVKPSESIIISNPL